jgi:hypothetical protein
VIHRPVEAVDPASGARGREFGEHRVARRAANALPEAVAESDGKDLRPRGRNRHEGPREGRQRVARQHEPLRQPCAIREPARGDLQHAVGGLGDTLDDAERHRTCAERPRQEQWQQRVHHLRGHVREQAHPSQEPDRAREVEERGVAVAGGLGATACGIFDHTLRNSRGRYVQARMPKSSTRLAIADSSDAFFRDASGTNGFVQPRQP